MPFAALITIVMVVTLTVALALARLRFRRSDGARIGRFGNRTGVDPADGSVFSVQSASITLPTERLDRVWDERHLQHLARLYWLYMEKSSLGLVRVYYDARGRYACFATRRIPLLGFHPPTFSIDADRGEVRWPIGRGLLIGRRGRDHGALTIEVRRGDDVDERTDPGTSRVRIQLEVSDFYPSMSSGFASWVYRATQSRYHVLLAYGFIHSLTSADLDHLRISRLDRALGLGHHEPPEGAARGGAGR